MAYEMSRHHTRRTCPTDKYPILVEVLEQTHGIHVRRRSDWHLLSYNGLNLASIWIQSNECSGTCLHERVCFVLHEQTRASDSEFMALVEIGD